MSKYGEALKRIQSDRTDARERNTRLNDFYVPEPQHPFPFHESASRSSEKAGLLDAPERRRARRHRCLVQGRATISVGHHDFWMRSGKIINISENGMLFEFQKPLSGSGSHFHDADVSMMLLADPHSGEEIEVRGRIVRAEYGRTTRFGIRFEDVVPEVANAIATYDLN